MFRDCQHMPAPATRLADIFFLSSLFHHPPPPIHATPFCSSTTPPPRCLSLLPIFVRAAMFAAVFALTPAHAETAHGGDPPDAKRVARKRRRDVSAVKMQQREAAACHMRPQVPAREPPARRQRCR